VLYSWSFLNRLASQGKLSNPSLLFTLLYFVTLNACALLTRQTLEYPVKTQPKEKKSELSLAVDAIIELITFLSKDWRFIFTAIFWANWGNSQTHFLFYPPTPRQILIRAPTHISLDIISFKTTYLCAKYGIARNHFSRSWL